jgi:hypothetical protein
MYACAEFTPKGPRDGFSTITCQEKREETRAIETETGRQRSPRHAGRRQKGSAAARSEITTVLVGQRLRKFMRSPIERRHGH